MKRATEFWLLVICGIFSLFSSLLCFSWIKEDNSGGNAFIFAILYLIVSVLFFFVAYRIKSGSIHNKYVFTTLILSIFSLVSILNVLPGILGIITSLKLFSKRTEKKKILSIITVSKIYSLDKIADISDLNTDQTALLIEKMIKASKNNRDYRIFRNAHINYQENLIVLDESKQADITDKIGKMTNSIIDSFTPKEDVKLEDWKCSYCGSINHPENYKCTSCNASKD